MSWFNRKPELKKTHDYCAVRQPKMTVVFIHGVASDSSTFNHAIKYSEGTASLKDARFVTFDLLGAGKSRGGEKYDYNEQLEALHNSIEKLRVGNTPLVLVGHSMGALIVARYADMHKKAVQKLILISAPIYTEKDLASPAFAAGIKAFNEAVILKNRRTLNVGIFENMMRNVVLNRKNYKVMAGLTTPAVLIYGNMDQFIAPRNIPGLIKENPKYLTAIKTEGRHGVSRDKYTKIPAILEEVLHA